MDLTPFRQAVDAATGKLQNPIWYNDQITALLIISRTIFAMLAGVAVGAVGVTGFQGFVMFGCLGYVTFTNFLKLVKIKIDESNPMAHALPALMTYIFTWIVAYTFFHGA